MSGLDWLPTFWAQAAGTGMTSLAPQALRRWYSSLTLASPGSVPSLYGLWSWLAGLAGLLVLAMLFQGPGRALGQLLDLPGHFRLLAGSMGRLRRSGKVLAATIGLTVVAWTMGQIRTYNVPLGRDDLVQILKSRSLVELAVEQGTLAALTPFRDVFGLGDNLALLFVASLVLFRRCAERWSAPYVPPTVVRPRSFRWGYLSCLAGVFYLLYRLVCIASRSSDLPMQGPPFAQELAVPALMALCDGLLLAWILAELRTAGLGDAEGEGLGAEQAAGLLPGAALACLAALPARYWATAVLLTSYDLPASLATPSVMQYIRWQLSWGLAPLQGGALLFVGLAGAVAWTRGGLFAAVRGYGRLLAAEGGRLVAVFLGAGLVAGGGSALAYMLVLSLPVQTWVLSAADGYAHYATLPVGLLGLAAMVELGERSLPFATAVDEGGPATG